MKDKLDTLFNRGQSENNTSQKTLMTSLFRIPVVLVILAIILLGISVTYRTGSSLRASLENDSGTIVYSVASRLEDNAASIETLEESLADDINLAFDNMVINDEELDNKYILETAETLEIDELNYYDAQGVILYSTEPSFVGIQSAPDHPITLFQESGESRMIENLRDDSEGLDDNVYKYGAVNLDNGDIVQIGINADRLAELSNNLAYQTVVKNISYDENFDYVRLIDPNNIIIASGDENEIDTELKDSESLPLVNEAL